MKLFILAVVAKGELNTFYALQKDVALQPGGIRPAAGELEELNLMTREEAGSRRRRKFRVTNLGEQVLRDNWMSFLKDDLELEDVLRMIAVGFFLGNGDVIFPYLSRIAVSREKAARFREAYAASLDRDNPIAAYQWMRVAWEAERLRAEAAALNQIRTKLEKDAGPR